MSDASLAPLPHAAPEASTTRLEAFSDGVFAIALGLVAGLARFDILPRRGALTRA